jgi:multidrug efflux pump subunit AcrA (membrane-fusion protein)
MDSLTYPQELEEARMTDDAGHSVMDETSSSAGKWILLALAVIYIAGSLYFLFDLRGRVTALSSDQDASKAQIADLGKRIQSADAQNEALARQIGLTKKELVSRASELQRQQHEAEARLSEEQKQQIGQVSGEVASVKTDVGGVKTDVASTKSDLEATRAKLESTIGDLGLQSGLIAKTRTDLETLKHRGDRNYYEFTLIKGAKAEPVATVSLALKKTDPKRGKFTLAVTSDDKTIEKKDRNVSEPIQFYSGRDRLLYELVVWSIDKKKATGYLSTPKNAPVPITAGL